MIDRRTFLGLGGAAAASGLILFGREGRASAARRFRVNHTPAEWQNILGQQRYAVLREAATERPFTSPLLNEHRKGIFVCGACALPLFSSATKFDSGTGWPSFTEPAVAEAVELREDNSFLMKRTEVVCRNCGGHLGHVFDDGPGEGGQRYCINSCSLAFEPDAS